MKFLFYLFPIFLICFSLSGQIPVDVFIDGQAGSTGAQLTTNLMNTATHKTGVGWSQPGGLPNAFVTNIGSGFTLPGPVSVSNTVYPVVSEPLCVGFCWTNFELMYDYYLPTSYNAVSIGCAFYVQTNMQGGSYDFFFLNGSSGQYVIMQVNDKGFGSGTAVNSPTWVKVHGGSASGSFIDIKGNYWYWLTFKYTTASNSVGRIYDPATWTQVETDSTLPESKTQPANAFHLGWQDVVTPTSTTAIFCKDLMIDYTAAVFPLLPTNVPAAAQPVLTGGNATFGNVSFR